MKIKNFLNCKYLFLIALHTQVANTANFSETHKAKIAKLKKLDYADLAHENKGCPENSICSPEMAQKFSHWSNFLLALSKVPRKQQVAKLNLYLSKFGLPVSFLAAKEDAKNIQAAFWSSRCRHHNLKDQKKIYKGLIFLKDSNPPANIKLDDVSVLQTGATYRLPYQHWPIMTWNDQLVFTLDYDNLFFHVGVNSKGQWKVLNIPSQEINLAIDYVQRVACDKKFQTNKWHTEIMCKKIWNNKLKATQTVQMSWSCP